MNGFGLFQYLEAFFENGIPFRVFAVANDKLIKSNAGPEIVADDVIANLRGHEDEYDALVFACGDAVPKFAANADKPYNREMMEIIKTFAGKGKLMVGHCGAAMIFEVAGVGESKRMAVHPYGKSAIKNAVATDEKSEIDGNFYTAQTESTVWTMMPALVEALK